MRGPLEVRCPTCGAAKGEACVSVQRGLPQPKPHRQRMTRATLVVEGRRAAKRQRRSRRRMPELVVATVMERSGGRCEAAELWPSRRCSGPLQLHHVLRRSQGGQDTVDNIRALCWAHHAAVHSWPQTAFRLGLLRPRHGRRVA